MALQAWKYESRREKRLRAQQALAQAASDAMYKIQSGDLSGARQVFRPQQDAPDDSGPLYTTDQMGGGEPDPGVTPPAGAPAGSVLKGAVKAFSGTRDVFSPRPAIETGAGKALGSMSFIAKGGNPGTSSGGSDTLGKIGSFFGGLPGADQVPNLREPFSGQRIGDVGSDLGKTLNAGLDVLDMPRRFTPAFSIATGATGVDPEVDPETGLTYRSKPGFKDWGRGLLEAATRNPIDTYKEGNRATEERLNDPSMSEAEKVILGFAQDPLTLLTAGVVPAGARALRLGRAAAAIDAAGIAGRLGTATRGQKLTNLGVGLLESPAKPIVGAAVGSATGAQLAANAGASEREQMLATLGGGLLGGSAAPFATLDNAKAGARKYRSAIDSLTDAENRMLAKLLVFPDAESGSMRLPGSKASPAYRENLERGLLTPEDLADPDYQRVMDFALRNPNASGNELKKLGLIKQPSLPTSLRDRVVATMSGWSGSRWYADVGEDAVRNLRPEALPEYSSLMGVTTANKNPAMNNVATLAAMKTYREMLLDGTWKTADEFDALTPAARADVLSEFSRRMGGVQTTAFKQIAAKTYIQSIYEMGAQKSPSFSANIRQGGERRYGFETTNDRYEGRMAGITSIPKYALEPWEGQMDMLRRQAVKERRAGSNAWDVDATGDVFKGDPETTFVYTPPGKAAKAIGKVEVVERAATKAATPTLFKSWTASGEYLGEFETFAAARFAVLDKAKAPTALVTLWDGLMDSFPGVNEYRYLTGVNNALAVHIGVPPSTIQAATWNTGNLLFRRGESGGVDWLLGLKKIEDAINDAEKVNTSALANEVWTDRGRALAADVKNLDEQLLARGIDPYANTRDLMIQGKGTKKVPGPSYERDAANVARAAERGAFPLMSASWSPGYRAALNINESVQLHRAMLADPRIVSYTPDGRPQIKLLQEADIRHDIVLPEKLSTWEGGGEASMYIRLYTPNLDAARYAAALMGKAFDQKAMGLNFPSARGAPRAGLHVEIPDLTLDKHLGWQPVFEKYELDVDVRPDGKALMFPDWAGRADLEDRVYEALDEIGHGSASTVWYNGASELVEDSTYDATLAADRTPAGVPAPEGGFNPYSRTGASGLPDGLDSATSAYIAHVDAIVNARTGSDAGGPGPGAASVLGDSEARPAAAVNFAEGGSAVALARPSREGLAVVGRALSELEPTHLVSSIYGRLPFLRKQGIGQAPEWLTNAPDAYSTDSLIPLKDVLARNPRLPASARISNALWKTLGLANPNFLTKVDDPAVRQVGVAYRIAEQELIPQIADVITAVDAVPAFDGLMRNELGEALFPDGSKVQYINENGVPIPQRYAGWADILEHPSRFPEIMETLTPEKVSQLRQLSDKLGQIQRTSQDMGIRIEGAVEPSEGGFYTPRGRPGFQGREEKPVTYRGDSYAGRKAGSTQERLHESQAQGISRGRFYPDPVEAVREYVRDNLSQQNAVHAAEMLKRIEVDDKPIRASFVPDAVTDELEAVRKGIKPKQRELAAAKAEKARVDRNMRLEGRFQMGLHNRFEELRAQVTAAETDSAARAGLAHEAFDIARQQLEDSVAAAREFAAKTAKATSESDAKRAELREVLDRGTALSKRLDSIEDEMNAARGQMEGSAALARHANFPAATYKEAEVAWKEAERVLRATVKEAQRIERSMLGLADVQGDLAAGLLEARTAAKLYRELLSDSLTGSDAGARASAIEMAEIAAREARAAANVRGAMQEGKAFELNRIASSRASMVQDMVGRQTELGKKIQSLAEQMEPMQQRRRELLQQVLEVRRTARSRQARYIGEVNLDPMRGVKVPADIANAMNKYIDSGGQRGTAAAIFDLVNNLFRSLGATLDASRSMTVGLLGQSDRPLTALKGVAAGVATAKDPQAVWRVLDKLQKDYAAKGIDIPLEEAVGRHGLQIAAGETTLSGNAPPSSLEERISRLPLIRQADALYSAPGNVERVERFYKTLEGRKARGQDYTSEQARNAAANIANLVSGRARRGVLAPMVGNEVSGRILFAGRFIESQFEVLANAVLTGGIEGDEARRALLRLTMGGTAMTFAINEMLGEETDLDAGSGNFMRVRVAGRDVSLFGSWDSLAKGMYGIAKTIPGVPGESGAERFARSKAGPLAALGYDLTRGGGENPVGQKVTVANTLPIPFGVRDLTEEALVTDFTDPTSLGIFGLVAGAALTGIKNSPMTATERLDEISQDIIDPATGKPNAKRFYDSPPSVQRIIKLEHPKLWEERVAKGTKLTQEGEEIKRRYVDEQQARDQMLLSGSITLEQWRNARDEAYARRDGEMSQLYKDADFPKRTDVLSRYYEAMDKATTNGIFDPAVREEFLESISQSDRDFIERNTGLYATPMEKLFKTTRSEYYDLPKYVGYTSDEAYAIDQLWQEVRNNAQGAEAWQMFLAIGKMDLGKYDPKVVQGMKRRVLGVLFQDTKREVYREAHPEVALLSGSGKLTVDVAEAIKRAA